MDYINPICSNKSHIEENYIYFEPFFPCLGIRIPIHFKTAKIFPILTKIYVIQNYHNNINVNLIDLEDVTYILGV